MKLTVLGATGGTGEQIIRQALAAGHEVAAVARRPEAVTTAGPGLRVVPGDVLDPAWAGAGIAGSEAVLSALGVRGSRAARRPTTLYSEGTAAVLEAMANANVRRLIAVTSTPVGPAAEKSLADRWVAHPLLHVFYGGAYDDMSRMEAILAASQAEWTVFRPPRLTGKPPSGRYRTAVDARLPRPWSLPRADLAAAMLAAVQDTALIGHAVTIAS